MSGKVWGNKGIEQGYVNFVKSIRLHKSKLSEDLISDVLALEKGVMFTPGLAKSINEAAGAMLVREQDDILHERVEQASADDIVEIQVETKLKLKVQLIHGTITEKATCRDKFLGPKALKEAKKIPYYVPDECCTDAANSLGICFVKFFLKPGKLNEAPGADKLLRANEQFWLRLYGRRFWSPVLVVSEAVAKCGALNHMDIRVFDELSNKKSVEMFLLLPAIPLQKEQPIPKKVTSFYSLTDNDFISAQRAKDLNDFFFGPEEHGELVLVNQEIYTRQVEFEVPVAIAGKDRVKELQKGSDPNELKDVHGVAPHPELHHYSDFRNRFNAQILGAYHTEPPKVQDERLIPGPCQALVIDKVKSDVWFECPVGAHTVVYPKSASGHSGSVFFYIKTETSQKANDRNEAQHNIRGYFAEKVDD